MVTFTVYPNVGFPFVALPIPRNADVSRRIVLVAKTVLMVFCVRRFAKINNSVVVSDAVYVIDLINGPSAMMQKPSNTMRFILLAVHPDKCIPTWPCPSCPHSCYGTAATFLMND
jgi:hypothetical protein